MALHTLERSRSEGLFFDGEDLPGAWLRERAQLRLPPLRGLQAICLEGELLPCASAPSVGLRARVGTAHAELFPQSPGPWQLVLRRPQGSTGAETIALELLGVTFTNALAWLGRVTGIARLQPYRRQSGNRRLRITRIATEDGITLYDFSGGAARLDGAFVRDHLALGMNVAGFLTAHLGIGESGRCMVRAADAAGIAVTPIDLRLPCKNPRADRSLEARLRPDPDQAVTVVHLDPPASRDLEHHHGKSFRRGRYQIGYWAWELPEFPDAWLSSFAFFDEIWCPSEFARRAIAAKSPVPVLTMPHAIDFPRPTAPTREIRQRFGLPPDAFLFLVLYDLNSYSARKNPAAALTAFRRSGLADRGARLVIKVHSTEGNAADLERLKASIADLPAAHLITGALSRTEIYELEAACDCYVSLHRAEGFGLAVAECMYLGKPVITTDWSATAEFADRTTALPVPAREVELTEDHGPYRRGQHWAEPDLDAAAQCMRRVAEDPARCRQIGDAARLRIEERFAPGVIGQLYRRRLETLALQELIPWTPR
jgi:glycosyltransferase involved in cell wall biosynthesis